MSIKCKIVASILACIVLIFTCHEVRAEPSGVVSRIASWWMDRSVVNDARGDEYSPISDESEEETEEETEQEEEEVVKGRLPGMCKVPQEPAVMRCEIGSGFLCIDTPPGSVADDSLLIRGTMDRQGSVLASIRVAVQNEYTKKIQYVNTTNPKSSGCWDEISPKAEFCLDAKGRYSVGIPMNSVGPHTISISASRLSGESVEKKVRSSKVVAPVLNDSKVSYNPDIRTEQVIDDKMVMVTVDLLGDCQYCDFIGASTGGVKVSIDNLMQDQKGDSKIITCETTVEQGGQGRFIIGVPAGAGDNSMTISACNAAVEGSCPSVKNVKFSTSRGAAALEFISPSPMPAYDSGEYPDIDWRFKLGGNLSCVTLQFNRKEPHEVCADASGEFAVVLTPRVGINVATLDTPDGMEQFAWTFGWGKVLSPYDNEVGRVGVEGALDVSLSDSMLDSILIPFVNNFFSSDEFSEFLVGMLEKIANPSDGDVDISDNEADEAEGKDDVGIISIPKCDVEGGLGQFAISINGMPTLGSIMIGDFSIKDNQIDLSLIVDDVRAGINISPDSDGDGIGDKEPLPLIIGFDEAKIDIRLLIQENDDGEKLMLVSSPHDDCAYKGSSYCTHKPASLIPDNFIGNASPWGHFVWCDVAAAAGSVKKVCKAFNSINAQTVAVKEAILDSINSMIYCSGSSSATGAMKDYFKIPIPIGCQDGSDCADNMLMKILPSMVLPLWVGLSEDTNFTPQGVSLGINLAAGDHDYFKDTPDQYKVSSAGVVIDPKEVDRVGTASDLKGFDLGAGISLDAIGAIMYAAIAHGDGYNVKGLLDFDIHEPFFKSMGFDFVKECDAFEPIPGVKDKPPTLCYVRPRVMELLGSSLTSYDYFPAKQPLIMALRGSRALAPRISVTTASELPVVPRSSGTDIGATYDVPEGTIIELQLGGLEMSFYAIEVDKTKPTDDYGNLPIKFDANGDPIILSMRADDSNPWNGPIVSFDVSLLLGLELSEVQGDAESDSGYSIKIRTLADRSRLVITPIEGSNVTTIPSKRIISNLADQLMTAIAQYTPKESAFAITIPQEMAFQNSSDSMLSKLGLRKIAFMPDGLSLNFDQESNSIDIAIKAFIEQYLHYSGEEKIFRLP
ncbi:MAG: hypothetical protein HN337_03130 [Deltaproteobacteria bacterium]|jgi:hypothetical protein|nr:hypothetical protein [Deltaproteobacteria bacterium]